MDFVRKLVDASYDAVKPLVFELTKKDPEIAHEAFRHFAQAVHRLGLERFLFDNFANNKIGAFRISNAAGFNKNGDIPLSFLKFIGFDRCVIGTVTADPWEGADRLRIKRYYETESLVNWMGLPGIGADKVAKNLEKYNQKFGIGEIPMTASLMSTPGKQGLDALKDIRHTLRTLRDFPYINRWESDTSCPNTHSSLGALDARREYQTKLAAILEIINEEKIDQQVYVKVPPDLSSQDIEQTFEILTEKKVNGIVVANTTAFYDVRYIIESPEKGGASGNAVYDKSLQVQKSFANLINRRKSNMQLIACGGIDSLARAKERTAEGMGCNEIQIYTTLIFRGPKLLRELKKCGLDIYIRQIYLKKLICWLNSKVF